MLVGGFTIVIQLFVVFWIPYGLKVEYRFEVAAITVDWTVLIVTGTLLAFAYRQRGERTAMNGTSPPR